MRLGYADTGEVKTRVAVLAPEHQFCYNNGAATDATAPLLGQSAKETDVLDDTTKRCTKCGKSKPRGDFYNDRTRPDGKYPYCKDCQRQYARRYAESQNAKKAEWRKAHPKLMRQYRRRYYEQNRERWSAYTQDRRARLYNAFVESVNRSVIYERDGGICHICGRRCAPDSWDLDHLVPLRLGGEHSYKNVAVACPECNRKKGYTGVAQLRLIGGM